MEKNNKYVKNKNIYNLNHEIQIILIFYTAGKKLSALLREITMIKNLI